MPFNPLFLTCLSPKTSFSEKGGNVGIKPQSGEQVLFFVIDQESNDSSTVHLDLEVKGPICDLLVYYGKGSKKVLCFVELKGSDVSHAVEQIVNTHGHFKKALISATKGKKCAPCCADIIYRARIHLHGSSPQETKKYGKKLEQHFGKHNFEIGRGLDIGTFLRK